MVLRGKSSTAIISSCLIRLGHCFHPARCHLFHILESILKPFRVRGVRLVSFELVDITAFCAVSCFLPSIDGLHSPFSVTSFHSPPPGAASTMTCFIGDAEIGLVSIFP